jgi:hypothetical protein
MTPVVSSCRRDGHGLGLGRAGLAARIRPQPLMLSASARTGALHTLSLRRLGLALPPRRAWHWLALALCLAAGAGLNLYRTAWRLAGEVQTFKGFYAADGRLDGQTVRWSRAYSKAEAPLYRWGPLHWRVQLTAPPGAPPAGASAWILVNDTRVRHVTVGAGWQTIDLVTDVPPARDLALQFYSTLYGPEDRGIGVGRVDVEPVFTLWNVFQNGLLGALTGLLLWLVCLLRPEAPQTDRPVGLAATPEEASAEAAASARLESNARTAVAVTTPGDDHRPRRWPFARALTLLLLLWLYLGLWAVLKPLFQAPDEPQHLLRAASVRLQPWAARTPDVLTLDPRFLNPLVLWPPPNIGNIFFNAASHLSYEDIAILQATPWQTPPPLAPYRTPLATYPTGYYSTIFGLAEATTWLGHLTPYQNTYAYRAWTVMLAGLLWLAVHRVLQRTPGAERHATALLAFLVLNPMLAFVTSSVTPDSVNVPLATLAVLLVYRTLVTGGAIWLAAAALLACGLTKPSFLLILGSLPLPMLVTWRAGAIAWRQMAAAALAAARAGAIGFCAFYAWSPPRFFGGNVPKTITLGAYASYYIDRLPMIWRSYWGVLGWLDYQLDTWWYAALLAIVVVIAIAVRRRTPDEARLARFAALLGVSYLVLMTIGEYAYLSTAGYNFQGRHLFPACIAFSGLMLHDNKYARWTLLGFLAVMNVVLMHETIVRYFNGDLARFWASLPFS